MRPEEQTGVEVKHLKAGETFVLNELFHLSQDEVTSITFLTFLSV